MLELPRRAKQHYITPNGVDTDHFQPLPPKPAGSPPTLVFVVISPMPEHRRGAVVCRADASAIARGPFELAVDYRRPGACRLEKYRDIPGLEFVGFQREIRPFFQQADMSIVPLRSGQRHAIKILESWAMGRPVVSTTIGAEGLPYRDGENILIADDPATFVAASRAVASRLATCRVARAKRAPGRRARVLLEFHRQSTSIALSAQ